MPSQQLLPTILGAETNTRKKQMQISSHLGTKWLSSGNPGASCPVSCVFSDLWTLTGVVPCQLQNPLLVTKLEIPRGLCSATSSLHLPASWPSSRPFDLSCTTYFALKVLQCSKCSMGTAVIDACAYYSTGHLIALGQVTKCQCFI